jgi:hypothetical protein
VVMLGMALPQGVRRQGRAGRQAGVCRLKAGGVCHRLQAGTHGTTAEDVVEDVVATAVCPLSDGKAVLKRERGGSAQSR